MKWPLNMHNAFARPRDQCHRKSEGSLSMVQHEHDNRRLVTATRSTCMNEMKRYERDPAQVRYLHSKIYKPVL